ncbi:MAG: hypothetical protein IPL23_13790 [Saprospiraceae bacterium]|nr:hypothetical protein [Saprospiraceae bacterium]
MIKLFRNIRQSLLTEGKPARYLKYALGEIVLVVIGILIALQINNWNESRKSSDQEMLYLSRLLSENMSDVTTFEEYIRELEKGNETDIALSEALKDESTPDLDLIQKANDYFKYGSIFPIFTSSSSTFDDLSSTGNLKLLSNTKLRENIVQHYAKHIQLKERIKTGNDWALTLDGPFTSTYHIMQFEPSTSFLFPKENTTLLAQKIKAGKLDYISNAAAHYWINKDCIDQLQLLKSSTSDLIEKIADEIHLKK